jgi:transposase-like protein
MTTLPSLFSSLARGERDPRPAAERADSFTAECDICRRYRVFGLAFNLAGRESYLCGTCGAPWNGKVK